MPTGVSRGRVHVRALVLLRGAGPEGTNVKDRRLAPVGIQRQGASFVGCNIKDPPLTRVGMRRPVGIPDSNALLW